MKENLTPQEKRKRTLERKLGSDWRKKLGKLSKEARELKHGVEQYSRAGKIGGAKVASLRKPEDQPFKKNPELARKAQRISTKVKNAKKT